MALTDLQIAEPAPVLLEGTFWLDHEANRTELEDVAGLFCRAFEENQARHNFLYTCEVVMVERNVTSMPRSLSRRLQAQTAQTDAQLGHEYIVVIRPGQGLTEEELPPLDKTSSGVARELFVSALRNVTGERVELGLPKNVTFSSVAQALVVDPRIAAVNGIMSNVLGVSLRSEDEEGGEEEEQGPNEELLVRPSHAPHSCPYPGFLTGDLKKVNLTHFSPCREQAVFKETMDTMTNAVDAALEPGQTSLLSQPLYSLPLAFDGRLYELPWQ